MCAPKAKSLVAAMLVALGLLSHGDPLAAQAPRVDGRGDPLPEGAVARIGTARWRTFESSLQFTADGRYAVTVGVGPMDSDPTRLIDAATGLEVRRFDEAFGDSFLMPDNKTLIVASAGKVGVGFFDINTGKQLRRLPIEGIQCSWSRDGKRMAGEPVQPFGAQPAVCVWDLETGKELWTHSPHYGDFLLSPDGKILASRYDRAITLFDVDRGQELRRWNCPDASGGRTRAAKILLFSPDGKTLAAAEDKRVALWDVAKGNLVPKRKLAPILATARDTPVTLAFTRDGRFLAAGGSSGALYLWDLQKDELVRTIPDAGAGLPIYVLDFTPDARKLISQAHNFPSARLWDVSSGKEISPQAGNATSISAMTFSPDGKTIATVGPGDPACLWDAATGKLLRRFASQQAMGFYGGGIGFTPSGESLASQFHNSFQLRRVDNGDTRFRTKGKPPTKDGDIRERLVCANCALDEDSFVAIVPGEVKRTVGEKGKRGNFVEVRWMMIGRWDARTDQVSQAFRVEAENLTRFYLSPDRKTLVGIGSIAEPPQYVVLFAWDLGKGRELFRFALPNYDRFEEVSFSADSRTIFASARRNHVNDTKKFYYILEVASGKARVAVEHKAEDSIDILVREDVAAVVVRDKILLIDPVSRKELRRLQGYRGFARCLAFSPDGKRLASACDDTTALIWDVADLVKAPEKMTFADKELEQYWADLKGDDAEIAWRALRRLSQAPEQSVAWLNKRIEPAAAIPAEKIKRLVAQLDSPRFAERDQATRDLLQLDKLAEPVLEDAKQGASAEANRRIEELLLTLREKRAKGPWTLSGEPLRECRAVEVLERIGSPEAVAMLARLAKGSAQAVLTRQAQDSWQRLTQRTGKLTPK